MLFLHVVVTVAQGKYFPALTAQLKPPSNYVHTHINHIQSCFNWRSIKTLFTWVSLPENIFFKVIFPEYAASKVRDCLHMLTWLSWWSDCSHPALFTQDFSLTGNGAGRLLPGQGFEWVLQQRDRFARLLLWEPLIPQCILSASCICCFKIREETSMSLQRVTLISGVAAWPDTFLKRSLQMLARGQWRQAGCGEILAR